jgi:hypothetical protein
MRKLLLALGIALLATACRDAAVTAPASDQATARPRTIALAAPIIDNGDGTATLVFQPARGLNNGTDEGGLTTGKDAYVRMFGAVDYSSGAIPWHMHFNSDCNAHHSFSLYRFDVTELPDPATVVSAQVELYHVLFNFNSLSWPTPTTTFALFPVLTPWNELTVNWSSQPALGDEYTSVRLPTMMPFPLPQGAWAWYKGWASLDITDLYAAWKGDPASNLGFAYKRTSQFCEANTATWTYTASSDMQDGLPGWMPSSVEWRPRLVITYRVSNPLSVEIVPPSDPILEGTPFTLTANGTDPSGGTLTYAWTVDGIGAGTGTTLALSYPDGGPHTASVTVTNDAGGSATAQLDFLVADVPPVVHATFDSELLAGEVGRGSGTFTDPGLDSWTGTMDYGDGTIEALTLTAKSFTLSHRYPAAGTFVWRVRVSDDDGGTDTVTGTIVVLSGAQSLDRLMSTLNAAALEKGLKNSLAAKLENASKSLAKGNRTAALGQLGAFKNELDAALKSGRVSADLANALLGLTNRLLAVL